MIRMDDRPARGSCRCGGRLCVRGLVRDMRGGTSGRGKTKGVAAFYVPSDMVVGLDHARQAWHRGHGRPVRGCRAVCLRIDQGNHLAEMATHEENVEIRREGSSIAGTLITPATKLPGVLFVHGWGGSQQLYLARAPSGRAGLCVPDLRPDRVCSNQVLFKLCRPEFSRTCRKLHQRPGLWPKYADQSELALRRFADVSVSFNEFVAPASVGKGITLRRRRRSEGARHIPCG